MLNRDMYLRKLLLLSLIAAGISSCGDAQLESDTAAVEEVSPHFGDQVATGAGGEPGTRCMKQWLLEW